MGNQMDYCQQCHTRPTESTATKTQTSHIVLANKRQEQAAHTAQIKVANNKTVQIASFSLPQTPNRYHTANTNIATVTSSKIRFAHKSQLMDSSDVRLGYQPPTSSPPQLKYSQSQHFTPHPQRDIAINQAKKRQVQSIQHPSQIRYPQQISALNQTQKIVFNYNHTPQNHTQKVNIINQASFPAPPFQQSIVYRSQLVQQNRVSIPVQPIVQPIIHTQVVRPVYQNKSLNLIAQSTKTQVNSTVKEQTIKEQTIKEQTIKEQTHKDSSKANPRQLFQSVANLQDSFLTHHVRYELSLTKYASMKRIRKRQVMEHIWLQSQWENFVSPRDLKIKFGSYSQSIISAWMQRTFLDIWQQAHNDFFIKHLDYKVVRYKVAEQYMHQLYQLKQFADSSAANLNFLFCSTQFDLNTFLQYSDDSLLHLFKKLKDRYPQTSSKDKMEFPDVPTTKTNLNILDHFSALSFSDPKNLNYQTIYEDINFLLSKAMEEQDGFKQDMKEILGADVLGCTKVGQVTKDGKSSFNACAVRRVFVKWAENILQKCPDLFESRSFMRFVQTRGKIANNFIFKSTVQDSTHKFVIDTVSLLLEAAKFSLKDNDIKKRQQFIFNIYDLLRCKIKRSTPTQIVNLLQKMKSTSVTKNGKKFEVIRVKNRFNTNNRDLLINFRYGDVLIGEAQLCVDNAQLNKQAKLNYDFCHYIYELERSIFGPTLELMMEYEDFQRPDITVTFEAEDIVQNRKKQKIQKLQNINRKCIQGHKMVSLVGNVVFSTSEDQQEQDGTLIICNYCDSRYPCSRRYDYCYLCGCMLCTDCRQIYEKANKSTFYLSIQSNSNIPVVNTQLQLQQLCQNNISVILLFWLQNSSPSELLRDGLVYQQSKQIMQPNKYVPRVAMVKYSGEQSVQQIASKYRVKSFPSMILLDSKANAVRTVIGCSWFQVPVFYSLQQKMTQEGTFARSATYCIDFSCKKEMFLNDLDPKTELICQVCFNRSEFIHFPEQLRNKGFFCQNSHYQCINCCYINFDTATTHQDFMGQSYLSSNFTQPIIQKCVKGHSLQIVYQHYPNDYLFKCSACQRQNFIDNQHGIGECQTCNIKLCSSCLGAKQPNYQSLQSKFQLVSHYVQSTAEDTYLCVCKRFFKKSYQKRYLKQDQFINGDRQTANWLCQVCEVLFKDGQLHIACFCCPQAYDQQSGQNLNFQVCYECAKKSKMIRDKSNQIPKQKYSYFTCPSDNTPMVFTSLAYKKQLIFNCHFCTKSFYRNTSRFYCKQCTLNVCKDCREQLEKQHFHPPSCKQTCPKEHNLQFQFVKQGKYLQLCDGCKCTLLDEKFTCSEDKYDLCLDCSKNKPPEFKGTLFA